MRADEGLDVDRLAKAIEIEDDRLPFLDAGIESTATPRAVAEQIAYRYARLRPSDEPPEVYTDSAGVTHSEHDCRWRPSSIYPSFDACLVNPVAHYREQDESCPICGISENIPSSDHDHRANFR